MIMCLCLLFVLRHSPYNEERPLTEVLWQVAVAFVNAGETIATVSISSRILLLTLYLMIMIIHAHYNSFLISSFTGEEDYVPFTDMRGMYEARTYSFGIAQGSATEDNIKLSPLPLFKSIWNEIVMADPRNILPVGSSHEKRLCADNYAAIISQSYLKTRVMPCELLVLPGKYFRTQTSMPLQKGSPLLSTVRFQMRRLAEFGILDRVIKKWTMNIESSDIGVTPISALQTSTAFFFLVISYLTALIILAIEIIYTNWHR
ncbi:glutamate receptor 1-like [Palaemon carinicauda]|uniref:glutamate receptor 1-like n=1 Tax=Palaemon carinicauda TaxID=392227 RepID=UPI0035B5A351